MYSVRRKSGSYISNYPFFVKKNARKFLRKSLRRKIHRSRHRILRLFIFASLTYLDPAAADLKQMPPF
jgi:hypothetical protein